MRRQPLFRATLALLTFLVAMMSAAPALADASNDRALAQTEPFTWWMESRYELGWRLYDAESHSYPNEYLYPDGWQVGFDACDSPLDSGAAGTSYTWHVEEVTGVYSADFGPTDDCRLDQDSSPQAPRLPEQGTYIVTLTVAATGSEPVTASQSIEVKDLLIVSIGDSNASGEGNPHVNQAGGLRPVDGIWFETRCHRSANSGHARTAATIEANDPHTAVTFLSFACSGAEIWDGLISGYGGIESSDGSPNLDPQVISIMESICQSDVSRGDTSCVDNPREIDSLFLSVGLNDVGFSAILINCIFEKKIQDIDAGDVWIPGIVDGLTGWDWDTIKDDPVDYFLGPLDEILSHAFDLVTNLFGKDWLKCGEDLDPFFDMNMAALWSHYALLGEVLAGDSIQVAADIQGSEWDHRWMSPSLRREFIDRYGSLSPEMAQSIVAKDVYVTSYPVDPFTDEHGAHGGCGLFQSINMDESFWINSLGVRLNRFLEWQTEKHRWHFVDGITEGLEGHGYCAGDESYYVSLSGSLINQGNHKGTIHPNSSGHNVTRDMLLATYYGEKPDWSLKHGVTFDVEAVRISDNRENPQPSATFTAKINDRWYRHEHMINQVTVPVGEWNTLPEGQFRFQSKLADDEIITVLAHTSLGGGLFYPPKCYSFECAEAIPATVLRTERDYSLANGWGSDYTWCENGPRINFFTANRTCTVTVSDPDFTLELRVKVTVVNLSQAPAGSTFEPGDQVACGNHCDGPVVATASTLDEYIEYLEAVGEDASAITILAAFIEEKLALE